MRYRYGTYKKRNTLLDSYFAEKIEVFSILESRLRYKRKQPDTESISLAGLPSQILIVRGGAEWAKNITINS
jgi:hypothetical protein